jgi:hypothetical protein
MPLDAPVTTTTLADRSRLTAARVPEDHLREPPPG